MITKNVLNGQSDKKKYTSVKNNTFVDPLRIKK